MKADEEPIAFIKKQADPKTRDEKNASRSQDPKKQAEGPKKMTRDERMKQFGHKSDIEIGQDSWGFLLSGINFKFTKEYAEQRDHLREGKRTAQQQANVDSIPRNEVEPFEIRESRTSRILETKMPEEALNSMFAEEDLIGANHPIGMRTVPERMGKQAILTENAEHNEDYRKATLIANPDHWESGDENNRKYDKHDRDLSDSERSSVGSQSFYAKDTTLQKYRFNEDFDFQSSQEKRDEEENEGSSQHAAESSNFGESWVPSTDYADERTKRHWAQSTDGN